MNRRPLFAALLLGVALAGPLTLPAGSDAANCGKAKLDTAAFGKVSAVADHLASALEHAEREQPSFTRFLHGN